MRCYKINGLNITANNEPQAKAIAAIIESSPPRSPRRLIFQPKDGSEPVIVDIGMECGYDIYTQNKNDVDYIGSLLGGTGLKIIQSAIDSIDGSARRNLRLGVLQSKEENRRRHAKDADRIKAFKDTVPSEAISLFETVMDGIGCDTDAYTIELIDSLESKGAYIKTENWMPILRWFHESILNTEMSKTQSERRTFYQLRAAFATTAARMVKGDARNANALRLASKEDDIDWSKYAKGTD